MHTTRDSRRRLRWPHLDGDVNRPRRPTPADGNGFQRPDFRPRFRGNLTIRSCMDRSQFSCHRHSPRRRFNRPSIVKSQPTFARPRHSTQHDLQPNLFQLSKTRPPARCDNSTPTVSGPFMAYTRRDQFAWGKREVRLARKCCLLIAAESGPRSSGRCPVSTEDRIPRTQPPPQQSSPGR